MKLGVVIVTYNSAAVIGACLDSCLRYEVDLGAGILVVDNASADETLNIVRGRPGIYLLANPKNLGFAAAVNQGFRELPDADALLILNPDAVLLSSPAVLARAFQDSSTGAACGLILDPDGKPQSGFLIRRFPTPASLALEVLGLNRVWPSNPINRRYRALDFDHNVSAWVEQPPGACLLVRREALTATGGFDEGFYPVWFEDVDFLRRMTGGGWRVRYLPEFRVSHSGGHSFPSIPRGFRWLYWYGSLLRYTARHFDAPGRWLVCGAVVVGMAPRSITGIVAERSFHPMAVCGRVVRLAVSYLVMGSLDTQVVCAPFGAAAEESTRSARRE